MTPPTATQKSILKFKKAVQNGVGVESRTRKFSAPAMPLHQGGLELPRMPPAPRSGSPASRRRFSNVSDVTRRISTTIGWRSVPLAEVITQAKCLCSQYIRLKLKRLSLLNKRLGLQRLRSVANLSGGWEVCEVFPRLFGTRQEMERLHPKLYGSVARQLSITLSSEKAVRSILLSVGTHLLRQDINWAKIISIFAVAAGLAADCVKQGHPEYVSSIIEAIGLVMERHSASWISSQGGWSSLLSWSQPPEMEQSVLEVLILGVAALITLAFAVILVLKFLGKMVT